MPNAARPQVLIIDDDDVVRSVTQQIVQRSGFGVILAHSGREGINLFAEHRDQIGCVLLDMSMPEMDGADTFRELRGIERDLRVIVISGYSADDLGDCFRSERPFAFIQKPFTISELDATLRTAMGIDNARVETTFAPRRLVLRVPATR